MVYVKIIQEPIDIIDTCKPVPTNFLLTRFVCLWAMGTVRKIQQLVIAFLCHEGSFGFE